MQLKEYLNLFNQMTLIEKIIQILGTQFLIGFFLLGFYLVYNVIKKN